MDQSQWLVVAIRPKGDAQKRLWVLGRFTYVGLVADNGRFEEMTVSGRLVGQQACQSPLNLSFYFFRRRGSGGALLSR